ncbi:MOSC domain-containing protein [Maribacter sp. 2308TA10-17]|uniref:MOSC domain-containing protein n=1 Tax=Maribacter sp. 2308TA10-17 TaxID=3386276 RepID=UPI0039BC72D3
MKAPYISKIRLYPVKSLDPVEVNEAEIGIRSLKHDRAFAMVAEDRRYVNGKRTGRVNQLGTTYDLDKRLISLTPTASGITQTFELREGNKELNGYLENYFKIKLKLYHRTKGELMDIPGASSVTILGEASLQSLHADLSGHTLEDLRLRFRANLELSGTSPFWEENLFETPGTGVRFKVGDDVEMIGISPRARCNVPPRNPLTGETDKSFVKNMIKSRANSLPEDSTLSTHGEHLYYLSVNTYLSESEVGKLITLGDTIEIIDTISL